MRAAFLGSLSSQTSGEPASAGPDRSLYGPLRPRDVLVWPETADRYRSLMRGNGVPFVFVGAVRGSRDEKTVSGTLLVNCDVDDRRFWDKVIVSHVEGRALADVEVFNLLRNGGFPEVEVQAFYLLGVPRTGGQVLDEAVESELYAMRPAYQKYKRVPCTTINEVSLSISLLLDRHCAYLSSSLRAEFLSFFCQQLDKAQDMVFVRHLPLVRPRIVV